MWFLPSWNILSNRKGKSMQRWGRKKKEEKPKEEEDDEKERKEKKVRRRGRRNSFRYYSSATQPLCLVERKHWWEYPGREVTDQVASSAHTFPLETAFPLGSSLIPVFPRLVWSKHGCKPRSLFPLAQLYRAGFIKWLKSSQHKGPRVLKIQSWFPFCLEGISSTREKQNVRGPALACFLSASSMGSSYLSPLRDILSQSLCHLLSQGQRFQFWSGQEQSFCRTIWQYWSKNLWNMHCCCCDITKLWHSYSIYRNIRRK